MMALLNQIVAYGKITRGEFKTLLLILNPFAPHITEELWSLAHFKGIVALQQWPAYDELKCKDDVAVIAVQICGKLRGTVTIAPEATQDEAYAAALTLDNVANQIRGKEIIKIIFVKAKLINIVVK
jgi:leucyl-tRNA synthetase